MSSTEVWDLVSRGLDPKILEKGIRKKFWKYCKGIFETDDNCKPTFSESKCFTHFRETLQGKHRCKQFDPPSWVKDLKDPKFDFNLEASSYQEISSIVHKTKASASPCPLDQLSILILKNCSILRKYAWEIIQYC